MTPELIINKATREESMWALAEHMQESIDLEDWESFLMCLRAAWEWVDSDRTMQKLFDHYFLAECRWVAHKSKFESFEQYCIKFLFEDVITSAEDKENAERCQKDVAVVLKYWLRHVQAAHFLTPHFVSQCSKKYFYDVLFLKIRLENAHQDLLGVDVDLDACWANAEDAKLFLKSVMRRADLIPFESMVIFLNDFASHRDLLWYLVSDHPHRFLLFQTIVENHSIINFTKAVFQKWAEDCQKELNPWERALSDQMIFKVASAEAGGEHFVFSSLILVRPGEHQGRTQCPPATSRSDFWPNFFFRWYAPGNVYFDSQRLSSDYLIYTRDPAKVLTKSLCHAWVLEHLTIRQYFDRVGWDTIKAYEPALAAQLEGIDFKEERGYFLWDCVRKKGGWREWLMAHWVILDHQQLQVVSQLKKFEWILGCVPGAYLAELRTRALALNQFLAETKRDLLGGQMSLASYKDAYQRMGGHQEAFEYHLKALACLQGNQTLLMSTNPLRKDFLGHRWCERLGYGFNRGSLGSDLMFNVDNFQRYIPPLCLAAMGLPSEKAADPDVDAPEVVFAKKKASCVSPRRLK